MSKRWQDWRLITLALCLLSLTGGVAAEATAADWIDEIADENYVEGDLDKDSMRGDVDGDTNFVNDPISYHPKRDPKERPSAKKRRGRRQDRRHNGHAHRHGERRPDHQQSARDGHDHRAHHHRAGHMLMHRLDRIERKLNVVLHELHDGSDGKRRDYRRGEPRRSAARCPHCEGPKAESSNRFGRGGRGNRPDRSHRKHRRQFRESSEDSPVGGPRWDQPEQRAQWDDLPESSQANAEDTWDREAAFEMANFVTE